MNVNSNFSRHCRAYVCSFDGPSQKAAVVPQICNEKYSFLTKLTHFLQQTLQGAACNATLEDLLPGSQNLTLTARIFANASQQARDLLPSPSIGYTLLVPEDAAYTADAASGVDSAAGVPVYA